MCEGILMENMDNIITTYAPETDMTFILEDDEYHTKVIGWYYGEPNAWATKLFAGKLEATYSKPKRWKT